MKVSISFKYVSDDKEYYNDLKTNKFLTTRDYWIEISVMVIYLTNSILGWIWISQNLSNIGFDKLNRFEEFIISYIIFLTIVNTIYLLFYIILLSFRIIRLISIKCLDTTYILLLSIFVLSLLPSLVLIGGSSDYFDIKNKLFIIYLTINCVLAILGVFIGIIIIGYYLRKKINKIRSK